MRKEFITGLWFTVFALVVSIFFFQGEEVYAEEDFSSAKAIEVNQSVMGNTEQGNWDETDYYKFTTSRNGYVTVNFRNPLQRNSDGYWNVWLYNSNYKEIAYAKIYGNKTSTNMVTTGLPTGTYYIKITSTGYSEAASKDIYTLTANFHASEYWEKEFNDEFVSATSINVNTFYYGTTRKGSWDESDYYMVNIPSNGVLTVNFKNPSQKDSEGYWKVYLYDKEYKELACADINGNIKSTNLPEIGVSKGKYYIKIVSTGYSEPSSLDKYTIQAKYSQSEFWEKEFNDDFVSATKINLNTTYYGTMRKGSWDESDYYQFNTNAKGNWVVAITTPNLKNSENYWTAYLYDASYNEIAKTDISGNIKFHILKGNLKKGTYYIKVDSAGYSDAVSTAKYALKVYRYGVIRPAATKITGKVRAKRSGFTLRWKKSKSKVSGYQIQYALRYDFKKGRKKNISKTKSGITVNKLRKRRVYFVRIRTYKIYNVNGERTKVYSAWSSVKKVRTR